MKPLPTYREFAPHPRLSEFVRCYWMFECGADGGTEALHRFRSLPLGLPEIIVMHRGGARLNHKEASRRLPSSLLAGFQTLSVQIDFSLPIGLFGVCFKPYGLAVYLEDPLEPLVNRLIPPNEVSPSLSRFCDGLIEAKDTAARVAMADAYLGDRLRRRSPTLGNVGLVKEANQRIVHQKGSIRIKRLAELLNVSQSTLERNFVRLVGISPKRYIEIIRNTEVLGRIKTSKDWQSLTEELSYFDQAHFIKDFKRIMGVAPSSYLNGPRSVLEQTILNHADFLQYGRA